MDEKKEYELWNFFADEHGLTLTHFQLSDIIEAVKEYLELKI